MPFFWLMGALFAAVSAYGWWFHFSVGPAHGAGAEMPAICGAVAALILGFRFWLKWRERRG